MEELKKTLDLIQKTRDEIEDSKKDVAQLHKDLRPAVNGLQLTQLRRDRGE